MKPALLYSLALVSIALACSCAPSTSSVSPVGESDCRETGGGSANAWRLVETRVLSFCVPPSWDFIGSATAPRWKSPGGFVSFGEGVPPRRVASSIEVVRVGDPLPPSPCQVRRFTERIDGHAAQLIDNACDATHYTGATWTSPAVYFQGEGSDPETARLQLLVYRSVRFTDPSRP